MPVTELFFNSPLFWIIVILTAPVITMRLFALEKSAGTYETLMTTPVGDLQVVAAKFTAALIFYTVMWLPPVACLFVVRHFTNQPGALDAGTLGGTCLGIFLSGCVFLSIGCFASSLTRSQVVAAVVSFVPGVSLFLWLIWRAPCPPRRNGRRRCCPISDCLTRWTISRAAWWTRAWWFFTRASHCFSYS